MFGYPYLDFLRPDLSKFYVHWKDINMQNVPRDLIFLIIYEMSLILARFMWEVVKRFQQILSLVSNIWHFINPI